MVLYGPVWSGMVWYGPLGFLREGLKKNGLFSDIDQIPFDTHPPPPKDDIWINEYMLESLPPTHRGFRRSVSAFK